MSTARTASEILKMIESVVVRDARGCWLWPRALFKNVGYAKINWQNRVRYGHRLVFELTKGPIPAGLEICHTCDVRHCVNPEHLFAGTHLENIRDCIAKGRAYRGVQPRGEQHHNAVLTADKVREMRQLYFNGSTAIRAVARLFSVSQKTARMAIRGTTWNHVK